MAFRKTVVLLLALPALLLLCFSSQAQSLVMCKRTALLMGGNFELTMVDRDSLSAEKDIDLAIKEISRIENLISDWKPSSQISIVNKNAGICPVKVDREVFNLVNRGIHLSVITHGAFDISFAAMDRIWKFDGSMTQMPSAASIRKSVEKVGYRNIILDSANCTIFLKLKGMKIGLGALGEGYAGDQVRSMMLQRGVASGIVNATGDLSTWGCQPDGTPWNIGLTNPFHPEKLLGYLHLKDLSVTTSGSYEKFVIFHGRRYSHIINPATGYPVQGLCSVTVFGPGTEAANGLSTSIMVLGLKAGLQLIHQYPAYSCIIITDKGKVIRSFGSGSHEILRRLP